MNPQSHIEETLFKLSTSPIIKQITNMKKYQGNSYGYMRMRLTLINGDFLEIAEYFVLQNDKIDICRYRYQWMDATQQILNKRWDDTKHFPHLQNFPHHVHVRSETQVVSGQKLSIIELIDLLEQELNT